MPLKTPAKFSGLSSGLANARPPGRAKLANAPPPGLTRRANAPQLPGGGGGGRAQLELTDALLNDKDSENTKKSTKQHRLIFESYLKEKNIRNPTTALELAAVLRKFSRRDEKKGTDRCTQKTPFAPSDFLCLTV